MSKSMPWQKAVNHQLKPSPTRQPITRLTALWLLVINISVVSAFYDVLASMTLAICLICFIWRIGIFLGQVAKPPGVLISLLAMMSAATMLVLTNQLGTLGALINLLMLGYALKCIEISQQRDVYAIVLVGFFLLALAFVSNQSIVSSGHLVAVALVNIAGLTSLFKIKSKPLEPMRTAVQITLLSLPLAILMFMVLPRFSPLWMVPKIKTHSTGLSESVRPGDISRLTLNPDLAFRATFAGSIPDNEKLYWRALVMDSYDGQTWQQNQQVTKLQDSSPNIANQRVRPLGDSYQYQVMVEPHGHHWLFSLERGYSDSKGVVNLNNDRLFALRRVEQKFGYDVDSYSQSTPLVKLSVSAANINLQVPQSINPRTRELASALTKQFTEPEQRLMAIMQQFANQDYYYHLQPPQIGINQIDDFLFETKTGFCVHYATAMVVLARESGIPARMITGYQGGELNQTAGYVSIYQYMAHAWVEAWIDGKGWVKFDPTAMVAPERVIDGFDSVFEPQESYLQSHPLSSLRLRQWPWLNDMRMAFASIDYYWSVWVLGFNTRKQQKLFTQLLGQASKQRIGLFVLAGIMIILLMICWYTGLLTLPKRKNKLLRKYNKLLAGLSRSGVNIKPGDGPRTIAQKVSIHNPQWQSAINSLTVDLEALLFNPRLSERTRTCLKRACISKIDRLNFSVKLYRGTKPKVTNLGSELS